MILNSGESEEVYQQKKYFDWSRMGCQGSIQEKDPSFLACSMCGRRTDELKIIHIHKRDWLVCKRHPQFKGE